MTAALLISVHFHDGRYHGTGPWPPEPARLFQALLAAAAVGRELPADAAGALRWLERLPPPAIAAPTAHPGQALRNYVPNNDLDAKGGDPEQTANIRAAKQVRPRLFKNGWPLLYAWAFDDGRDQADQIVDLAQRLYQLGRGVDMAWADAEVLGWDKAQARLAAHGGPVHRPTGGAEGARALGVPIGGSLDSLIERHARFTARFSTLMVKSPTKKDPHRQRPAGALFAQPPKPRFRDVAYDCPPNRLVFQLRRADVSDAFHAVPVTHAAALVDTARKGATARLTQALPEQSGPIERLLVGRGAQADDKLKRVRLLPLPSIGHPHADHAIRRLMLEVPAECPLHADDVAWAFDGLEPADAETGKLSGWRLVRADAGDGMPAHYGIGNARARTNEAGRLWRTVTPAALPEHAQRRRIDPERLQAEVRDGARPADSEAKDAAERLAEECRATAAVRAALRHAGIDAAPTHVNVQREPFAGNGRRAEAFAAGTRFSKHRLWHVEIGFANPRAGPLVIGDGRWLGLGLMHPVGEAGRGVAVFDLESPLPVSARSKLLRAVRRALMALDRDLSKDGQVSRLFSGHEPDGAPAAGGAHRHVFLAATGGSGGEGLARVYVVRPDRADRTVAAYQAVKARFDRVVRALTTVRAGPLGVLALQPRSPGPDEAAVFGPSRQWRTATPYRPTRHPRGAIDLHGFVADDVRRELARRGWPAPTQVEVLQVETGPRGGLSAQLRLSFATALDGPLLLGRESHEGAGLFCHDPGAAEAG